MRVAESYIVSFVRGARAHKAEAGFASVWGTLADAFAYRGVVARGMVHDAAACESASSLVSYPDSRMETQHTTKEEA